MQNIAFGDGSNFKVAILVPDNAFKANQIKEYYLAPLAYMGVSEEHFIVFPLAYDNPKKVSSKTMGDYVENLLPDLKSIGITTLMVADSNYFKFITKNRKADPFIGYICPCMLKGSNDLSVLYVPNYRSILYSPDNEYKIHYSLKALSGHLKGTYTPPGNGIIHSADYPIHLKDIDNWLMRLHEYPELTIDLETFSLRFWEAGIASVGFAWDHHNGVSFLVDYKPNDPNKEVRKLLKEFLVEYKGTLIYFNANFDIKILVAQLFMDDWLDEQGKQAGIEILTKKFHCAKIITYLATNSATGNNLTLKYQAQEFAGNYAQEDIDDVTKIPPEQLLEYNLVDCLSTWYVFNKYFLKLFDDNQHTIYQSLFIPSVKHILQMELTGLPLNMDNVKKARIELEGILNGVHSTLRSHKTIQSFNYILQEQAQTKANEKLKVKVKPITDFADVEFNPNSAVQLQQLLYDVLNLPVIDLTENKAPATGGDTLKKLINHTTDPEVKEILNTLIEFAETEIILTTFITAFENSSLQKSDGWWYLHGNFNLGGTVSGRLSSSKPNLQNIPSTGTRFAKLIKDCFQAPPGWLFVGADFLSLEDRISALTTKDKNKLKVYTDNYDGHCLRAYSYFGNQMPDIDPNSVDSINSIADKYKELRQKSKAPTFLLTYGGTFHGLMNNCGFDEVTAKMIESRYHELYKESDDWVASKIEQACKDGYVTAAFGLRVRTPTLAKTIYNSSNKPYEAQSEARTAGNALGQSFGLLNNRAGCEVQEETLKSPFRYDILPCASIHDAQYYIVRDDSDVVLFLNEKLIKAMQWQELPEIQHPQVGLGGELSIFYPTWKTEYVIPNNATEEILRKAVNPSK